MNISINGEYYCDKCEELLDNNEESIETRYGFICKKCAGH